MKKIYEVYNTEICGDTETAIDRIVVHTAADDYYLDSSHRTIDEDELPVDFKNWKIYTRTENATTYSTFGD